MPDPAEATAQPEVVNLSHVSAARVSAAMARMHQSAAQVTAEQVEISQGVVRVALVNAQGRIGAVAGESVTLEGARVGVTAAREVRGGRVAFRRK